MQRSCSEQTLPLVPWPEHVSIQEGCLEIAGGIAFVLAADMGEAWRAVAEVFIEEIRLRLGLDCVLVRGAADGATVRVETPAGVATDREAYTLTVEAGVRLAVNSPAGLHNACMTLLQLMRRQDGRLLVPRVSIADRPRFSWRGTLIDPARTFLPMPVVKRYIALIAELKLNVLHWHLTDDQGWRIESRVFPRLHEVGGRGGYYTQAEIREVVAFAQARNVMVVPEIDMPGHVSALLAAYPELSCTGRPVQLRQAPGIYAAALCASDERVYAFLEKLFDELAGLFPAPYVHIGSDELVARDWTMHSACRDLMAARGITDRKGLHAHFVARVSAILARHGKTLIAWDEIAAFAPKGAVVQAWRHHSYAALAARAGHAAICSPTTHCYFDYPHLATGLKKVYGFEPIPRGLDASRHGLILGAQVNLWGEWITPERLLRRAFPRLLGFAEVCWSPKDTRDWEGFSRRCRDVSAGLKARGVPFGRAFEPMLMLWYVFLRLGTLYVNFKDRHTIQQN